MSCSTASRALSFLRSLEYEVANSTSLGALASLVDPRPAPPSYHHQEHRSQVIPSSPGVRPGDQDWGLGLIVYFVLTGTGNTTALPNRSPGLRRLGSSQGVEILPHRSRLQSHRVVLAYFQFVFELGGACAISLPDGFGWALPLPTRLYRPLPDMTDNQEQLVILIGRIIDRPFAALVFLPQLLPLTHSRSSLRFFVHSPPASWLQFSSAEVLL